MGSKIDSEVVRIGLVAKLIRHCLSLAGQWVKKEDESILLLHQLERVIWANRNVSMTELISILEKYLPEARPVHRFRGGEIIPLIDEATQEEIVRIIEDSTVSKSALLYLAEHKLKIPVGNFQRMRAEEVRQELQNFLKSGRALEVITRLAGGNRKVDDT